MNYAFMNLSMISIPASGWISSNNDQPQQTTSVSRSLFQTYRFGFFLDVRTVPTDYCLLSIFVRIPKIERKKDVFVGFLGHFKFGVGILFGLSKVMLIMKISERCSEVR